MVLNISSSITARKDILISHHNQSDQPSQTDASLEMKILGSGGQGKVYKYQNDDGKLYAAKNFSHDSDFNKELNNYIKISEMHNGEFKTHPNIAQFFGEKTINGKNHLLIEFIDGENLNTFISNCDAFCKTLPKDAKFIPELRLLLAQQLISALNYLEKKGFSNADIKPDNIMINKNGELKIIDFGLMRERNAPAKSIGTHHYMAPEIILGKSHFYKTDSYSSGNVLLNILTGFYINQNYQNLRYHKEGEITQKDYCDEVLSGGKFTINIFNHEKKFSGKEINLDFLAASGNFSESHSIENRLKNEVIKPLLKLDPKNRAEIKDVFKVVEDMAKEYLTTENKEQAINLFKAINGYDNGHSEIKYDANNIKNCIANRVQEKIQASIADENNNQTLSNNIIDFPPPPASGLLDRRNIAPENRPIPLNFQRF